MGKLQEQALGSPRSGTPMTPIQNVFNVDNHTPPWTAHWERIVRQTILLESRDTSPLTDIFRRFIEPDTDHMSLQQLRVCPGA